MPNDFSLRYADTQDTSGLMPVFQNINAQQAAHNQLMQQQQQEMQNAANIGASYGKGMSGISPLAMAAMLRGGSGNVDIPATNTPQMSGVPGMGNSIGTGLSLDSYNSGVGFNPSAQIGGFGLKY